jgi:hypothetical protein
VFPAFASFHPRGAGSQLKPPAAEGSLKKNRTRNSLCAVFVTIRVGFKLTLVLF